MATATRTHVWFGTRSIDLDGLWINDGAVVLREYNGVSWWQAEAYRGDNGNPVHGPLAVTPGLAIVALAGHHVVARVAREQASM